MCVDPRGIGDRSPRMWTGNDTNICVYSQSFCLQCAQNTELRPVLPHCTITLGGSQVLQLKNNIYTLKLNCIFYPSTLVAPRYSCLWYSDLNPKLRNGSTILPFGSKIIQTSGRFKEFNPRCSLMFV